MTKNKLFAQFSNIKQTESPEDILEAFRLSRVIAYTLINLLLCERSLAYRVHRRSHHSHFLQTR